MCGVHGMCDVMCGVHDIVVSVTWCVWFVSLELFYTMETVFQLYHGGEMR